MLNVHFHLYQRRIFLFSLVLLKILQRFIAASPTGYIKLLKKKLQSFLIFSVTLQFCFNLFYFKQTINRSNN